MHFRSRRPRARSLATLLLSAAMATAVGCAGGQAVTPEALGRARALWNQAGLVDYELEWTAQGQNNAHYVVTVRGGEVQKVESVADDGRRRELHSNDPRYFGVEGLFLTIANELAFMKTDQPFGQPKGTRVVMRFKPDATLGYPLWYRRDVIGTEQSLSIEVLRLTPAGAGPK